MVSAIGYTILVDLVAILLLLVCTYFFGKSFYKIYANIPNIGHKITDPAVNFLDKITGSSYTKEMSPKEYAIHVGLFSLIGLIIGWVILMLQGVFTANPNGIEGMSWDLAFNTISSFVTNTNWQSYSGETQASYLSQSLVFTVQNFVSGAVGIAVLFALLRGITNVEKKTIGNFYHDVFRIICNVMIPVCFIFALILVSEGMPQTLSSNVEYLSLEGSKSILYLGPVASQLPIKQLFTNGGGFYGFNSAYPYENPTNLTNILECLSLLAIPAGLVYTLGKAFKQAKQGRVIFGVMLLILLICLVVNNASELTNGNSAFVSSQYLSYGNMEGKESRFGVGLSALWGTFTTAASNGSVNSMHDSFTPMGGLVEMFLMMLGEIVYGGVGSGLYGMLAFVYLTVFIAGLMVGRTPEYLGKKINSFDMKMVCLIVLTPILCLLLGMFFTMALPSSVTGLTTSSSGNASNNPAHFYSEILYLFVSTAGNNGSAFAGLSANNPWLNMVGGFVMLLVRFVPLFAAIFLAGSMSMKKIIPQSNGTLRTDNVLFAGLLFGVIIIVGALSFFPALALGPIAEALQ